MSENKKEIMFKYLDIECVELGIEYKRMQSILKRIAEICQKEKDKGFCMTRYGAKVPVSEGWDLASEILELLEIEEVK